MNSVSREEDYRTWLSQRWWAIRLAWFAAAAVSGILATMVGAWASNQARQDEVLGQRVSKLEVGFAAYSERLDSMNKNLGDKLDLVLQFIKKEKQ